MDFSALFETFKSDAGDAYASMTDEQKELAAEVFADYGDLYLRAQSGEDVSEEKIQVDSQLAGLGDFSAQKFQQLAYKVLKTAAMTALKLAILVI